MTLLRMLSVSSSILLLCAVPALALGAQDAEPVQRVAAAFGNTVTSTYPDGRSQKIWMQPDGTWTGLSRRGLRLAGTWSLRGDKVCLRQRTPPTLPFSYCTAFPADTRVGAAWPSRDFVGTAIQLRLDPGAPSGN
jgi:hypothetical protein